MHGVTTKICICEIRYGVKDTNMSTSYMKYFHVNAYEYGAMQTRLYLTNLL